MSRRQAFQDMRDSLDNAQWKEFLIQRRRQGNSTAQALYLISEAMQNPNRKIELFDSIPAFREQEKNKEILKNIFIPTLEQVISKLELEGLIIDKKRFTILYDLSFLEIL